LKGTDEAEVGRALQMAVYGFTLGHDYALDHGPMPRQGVAMTWWSSIEAERRAALALLCPFCKASPGKPCQYTRGPHVGKPLRYVAGEGFHQARGFPFPKQPSDMRSSH
jgi:hypothetical protein